MSDSDVILSAVEEIKEASKVRILRFLLMDDTQREEYLHESGSPRRKRPLPALMPDEIHKVQNESSKVYQQGRPGRR